MATWWQKAFASLPAGEPDCMACSEPERYDDHTCSVTRTEQEKIESMDEAAE